MKKLLSKIPFSWQDGHTREMLSGASLSFVLRMLGAIAQFGFSVIVARVYGAAGFGMYALALSVVVIASTIGRWGLDQSALKHISIFADRGEWGAVKEAFSKAVSLVAGLSVITMFLLALLTPWISEVLFEEQKLTSLIYIMVLSIAPSAILIFTAECLRALKKIGFYTLFNGLLVPVAAMLFLLVSTLRSDNLDMVAVAYTGACYFAAIGALLFWFYLFRKYAYANSGGVITHMTLLRVANPMALVALISIYMSLSETILLGVFHSSIEVGIYSAALRLALLINFIIIAFNSILAPKFAALYQQGALLEMETLTNTAVIIMLILTLPLFLVLFFAPEYLLMVFSAEFMNASSALMILAVGQLFNILTGPVGIILLMTGHESIMRRNAVIAVILSISFGIFSVFLFGVEGAAWAATFGMIVLNILSSWSVRSKVGINTVFTNMFSFAK